MTSAIAGATRRIFDVRTRNNRAVQSGVTTVPMGAPSRTGLVLPYPDEEDEFWNDITVVSMSDFCPATHNAVKSAFPPPTARVHIGMCSVHCLTNWRLTHGKGFFRDFDTNNEMVRDDFEMYKNSPWAPLIPHLREKMVEKWHLAREGEFADQWMEVWGSTTHTYSEMNRFSLLGGGIPCHNNSLESLNRSDKIVCKWTRYKTANFVHRVIREMAKRSHRDTLFCKGLNRDCCGEKFYRSVLQVFDDTSKNKPTFLNVSFDYSNNKHEGWIIPKGSLLVATTWFLTRQVPALMAESEYDNDGTPKSFTAFIRWRRFHEEYKMMLDQSAAAAMRIGVALENEEEVTEAHTRVPYCDDFDFDGLIAATKRFHLLTPITFESDEETVAISNFLESCRGAECVQFLLKTFEEREPMVS